MATTPQKAQWHLKGHRKRQLSTSTKAAASYERHRKCLGTVLRDGALFHRLQRKAQLLPTLVAAVQRTHAIDAQVAQPQRGARAGGIAGTGAVQHDVAVPWNACAFGNQRVRFEKHSSRQPARVGKVIQWMAQVDNVDLLAGVEQGLQFFGFNLGAANLPQEGALPVHPVTEEAEQQQNEKQARRMSHFSERAGMPLQKITEKAPAKDRTKTPDQSSGCVEGDERRVRHLALAGNRRRDGTEPGNELCQQQRALAVALEEVAGAPHADRGLE